MSKSDKDLESRTVAKSPLQQSSFVFFPEEEKIRKELLKNPELTLQAANNALVDQQKKIEKWKTFLQGCYQTAQKTVKALSAAAVSFAQKLPQSVFGVGDGNAFLIPLDFLFEKTRAAEYVFNELILKLDPFWQPDRFDPSRFAFLESIMPQANVADQAKRIGKNGDRVQNCARNLSEQIDSFLSTVIHPFVTQAASAADLDGDGANMRFGKLCALCGELQSAAARFAEEWSKQLQKLKSDLTERKAKP